MTRDNNGYADRTRGGEGYGYGHCVERGGPYPSKSENRYLVKSVVGSDIGRVRYTGVMDYCERR